MEDLKGLCHLFACAFLFTFASCIVIPSITDVTMEALCPGEDQCSLAIYLTGFTQAITGLGTFLVTPVIGNLSDKYGRKTMLTLPMTVGIIPLVILAFGRTRPFFYAYYFIKMFTGMFCEGTMQCLTLAYVADKTCEGRRISAFGVLSGISAAGFVSATLTARFLPTVLTFQVSAAVAISAMLYMRFFLAETDGGAALAKESCRPLCPSSPPSEAESSAKLPILGKVSSLSDMVSLFRSSLILSRAAIVAFIDSLGSSGFQASILYFLKAKFQFSKDQYADLMLISGVAGAISQLLLMPAIAPAIGEEILLSVGLLAGCANVFLTSIAWSSWVPYFSSTFVVLSVFLHPCLRTIVSKRVGPNDQGLAQGGITGISSIASIVSPMLFTPLTALFLSESAPFDFKGFSLMCSGFAHLTAFALSVAMNTAIRLSKQKFSNGVAGPIAIFQKLNGKNGRRIAQNVVAMATGEAPAEVAIELPEIVKTIQEAWDKLEDKYAVTSLAFFTLIALYGSAGMISAIDRLPLLPSIFELVGIGYTGWFAYRHFVFKPDREALIAKIKSIYSDVIGSS